MVGGQRGVTFIVNHGDVSGRRRRRLEGRRSASWLIGARTHDCYALCNRPRKRLRPHRILLYRA